jgi:hypothetical protein
LQATGAVERWLGGQVSALILIDDLHKLIVNIEIPVR